jgi:Reverse transcriptase (RNA-dependent DNA polymerase)
MVSFDVCSLFTNIPLHETIDIAVNLILENNPRFTITKVQLRKLFLFATAQTHFLFDTNIYDQIDGVAMGSPLGPVLANLFMGVNEREWLSEYSGSKPCFYRRYVDDVFCLFKSVCDVKPFLEYLNSRHPSIKFTVEYETDRKLPFLDVLVDGINGDCFTTSIYRKVTFTGLLTNFNSFCSNSYKIGLIKTLIDRVFKINSSWSGFHSDLEKTTIILAKNQFPESLISKYVKSYLHNKFESKTNPCDKLSAGERTRYYKLPYIGFVSNLTNQKIRNIVSKYCVGIDVKLIFVSFKSGSYFSLKDPLPKCLQSGVIYKFVCAGCNACYIGESSRHLKTRIDEHLGKDKSSHIYKHLQASDDCKRQCSDLCFSVLDEAPTDFQRKLKEAMFIQWLKPNLNAQLNHLALTLSI